MGKLIELHVKQSEMLRLPAHLWALRWRIITETGLVITSSWTPETRYPSIRETVREFGGRIEKVIIEGKNLATREVTPFLSCPGDEFGLLSFKAMGITGQPGVAVIGIEVEDVDGIKYLVLRDGTVFVEERAVDVANNN